MDMPRSSSKRLLFVDDDPLVRQALTAMLRHLGWEVTSLADPRMALETLTADPTFDVLLTDQEMPELLGTELAAAARKVAPELWIVLCSGTLRLPDAELARHGIDAMVTKPVSQASLATALAVRRV